MNPTTPAFDWNSIPDWLLGHADALLLGGVALLLIGLLRHWLASRAQQQHAQQLQQQLAQLALQMERLQQGQVEGRESAAQGRQTLLRDLLQAQSDGQRRTQDDAQRLRSELLQQFATLQKQVSESLAEGRLTQQQALAQLKSGIEQGWASQRESFEQRQADASRAQQRALADGVESINRQLGEALARTSGDLQKRFDGLNQSTDQRLKEISGQVEKRLAEGFEKTTETFTRVLEHLSRIDEAQKKITELSSNVVSLQEVLTDKRSRGAFGEVQLAGLVRNLLPESAFALQQKLSNGTRVDCLLYLPQPTGNVAIDAKFPLESFQRMMDGDLSEIERAQAARQFKQDIRKHIDDISSKYLIEGETADGAVMFLPAEAVFAEIHAHHPELVDEAQRKRVWLVSPTTLMAILTTARAVIKDEATRKQVHIIQEHLRYLSADFGRFQQRMDKLATHIGQAHKDVEQIGTSARKISSRFEKIEKVELEDELPVLEQPRLDQPAGGED